jgi:septal ring factor EnvC (AmiA/AmiB activator)
LNTASIDIQEKTESIHSSVNNTNYSIKEVYSIGSSVNEEIEELDKKIREIEVLIKKMHVLNSENSRNIDELNIEMEKMIRG